jgi:hypothetical protein
MASGVSGGLRHRYSEPLALRYLAFIEIATTRLHPHGSGNCSDYEGGPRHKSDVAVGCEVPQADLPNVRYGSKADIGLTAADQPKTLTIDSFLFTIRSGMSDAISPVPQPADSDAPAWDAAGEGCAEPSSERRLKMLDRLAEAGLQIALAIEQRVKDAEPGQPLSELNAAAMAYGRASRAVRLAILLQEQLSQGRVDPLETARQAEAAQRKLQVDRTVRIVGRVAKDHCRKQGFALGAYVHEARERLDNDDIYGLVATRPVGELVAMICQDLGLKPHWEHLAAEAWAQAEIESGAQGSPFVDWDLDEDEDEDAEDDAARPEYRPPTFQDACRAASAAPAILAVAARRDTG